MALGCLLAANARRTARWTAQKKQWIWPETLLQNLESCKGCKRVRGLEGFRSLGTGKRQAWTPISRFDLGKLRRRSSTPAVVPGAAPALAKAGVGGYIYIFNWNGPQYTTNSTNMICVCPQWGIPQKGEANGGQGWSTIQMDTSTQRGHFERIKSVKKKLGLNQHGL